MSQYTSVNRRSLVNLRANNSSLDRHRSPSASRSFSSEKEKGPEHEREGIRGRKRERERDANTRHARRFWFPRRRAPARYFMDCLAQITSRANLRAASGVNLAAFKGRMGSRSVCAYVPVCACACVRGSEEERGERSCYAIYNDVYQQCKA